MLKSEHAKGYAYDLPSNLDTVFNDQDRAVSPRDGNLPAFVINSAATLSTPTATSGQVAINISPALEAGKTFGAKSYEAVVSCDIDSAASNTVTFVDLDL